MPTAAADVQAESNLSVFLHGSNDHGSLCLPLEESCEVPTRLLSLRSQFVRACCAGAGWSAVATGDGSCLAWGAAELPVVVDDAPAGTCALVCGPQQVFALTDEGEVHVWDYRTAACAIPQQILLPIEIIQLACGDGHVLAMDDAGIVFSWGRGVEGQLGRPPPLPPHDPTPQLVNDSLPDEHSGSIMGVACGGVHSVLLTTSGELLGCGPRALLAAPARQGQFGGGVQPVPSLIDGPWQADVGIGGTGAGAGAELGALSGGVRSVACGRAHTLVVGCDGRLYAFGEGAQGQLGHSGGGPFGRPLRCGGSLASLRVDEAWASPLADVSFARATPPDAPGTAAGTAGEPRYFMWGRVPGCYGGEEVHWRVPEELEAFRGEV